MAAGRRQRAVAGAQPLRPGKHVAGELAAYPPLPILIFFWSPLDFLNVVLHFHLSIEPDVQSLTMRSAAHDLLGFTVPSWLATLATLLLTGWVSWRAPVKGGGVGLWMGTALLLFCFLYIKGYFNYFNLCSYLWVVGLATLNPEGEQVAAPQPAPVASDPLRTAA